MTSQFRPKANGGQPQKSAPVQGTVPAKRSGGAKAAFSDSVSATWQIARRPWMWVLFPTVVVAFLVLLSGGANLLFKTATGEQNSLPLTPDGVVTGAASGVRGIFGATREQALRGVQPATVNPYNQPLASPAAKEKEPLQPNVP